MLFDKDLLTDEVLNLYIWRLWCQRCALIISLHEIKEIDEKLGTYEEFKEKILRVINTPLSDNGPGIGDTRPCEL